MPRVSLKWQVGKLSAGLIAVRRSGNPEILSVSGVSRAVHVSDSAGDGNLYPIDGVHEGLLGGLLGRVALCERFLMSDISEPPATAQDRSAVAPRLHLSRRGLCICLFLMVAAGLSVYALFPERVGGPPLPVTVELGKGVMPTADGAGKMLTEVIVLTNLTDDPIPRFSIEINDQYLLFRDAPLAAKERLELPQRVFTDKRSNHRFNPIKYPVEAVTLTGQLPSGARGVTRFDFEDGVITDTH